MPAPPGQRRVPAPVERGRLVVLRYITASDRDEFVRLRRDSRAHLEPWEPRSPRAFDAFGPTGFERELRLRRTPRSERLLVCRADDGAIAGKISINHIVRGSLDSCTLGYWTGAPFVGRGYMTEAIGLLLRHAFTRLRLHRIEANIQPHNLASRAVVARNGFRLEGLSPRFLRIAGAWADHERWAITFEDWTGLRRSRR